MNNRKLLVVSHLYPRYKGDHYGAFIHKQVKSVQVYVSEILVLSPVSIFKYKTRKHLTLNLDNINIIYPLFFLLPGRKFAGLSALLFSLQLLFHCSIARRRFKFGLLHSHFLVPDCFASVIVAKLFKVPLVSSIRGSDINVLPKSDPLVKWLSKIALRLSTKVTCVSQELARVTDELLKCNPNVIYNGCDLILEERNFSGSASKAFTFLFVGNLVASKGLYDAFEALREVKASQRDIKFVVVGDGPEKACMQTRVSSLGLAEAVEFIGKVDTDKVKDYMINADAFLFPSYNEGLPNVVLEAARTSLPIISTSVGGIPEVIKHGESGLLVPVNQPQILAKYMLTIITDKSLREQLAANAYKRSLDFTWEINAADFASLYEVALNRGT